MNRDSHSKNCNPPVLKLGLPANDDNINVVVHIKKIDIQAFNSYICKNVSSHYGELSSSEPKEKTRSPFKG